jgi:aminocarboxymuconate-semialdehyde decarboxylase
MIGTERRKPLNGTSLTVDMHCHFTSRRADELALPLRKAENEPTLAAIAGGSRERWANHIDSLEDRVRGFEQRLRDMDRMGIDVQIVSPGPMQYFYYLPPEVGREASRLVNDDIAVLAATHPDRLVAMGTVPLQDTGMALEELDRCIDELGLRAIELSTHVNGEELSIERLRPFFGRVEERGIVLFLHPLGATDGRRLTKHYFINSIGNPLESTIAVAHLIYDGVLDAYPALKLCVAHGGGYLAQCTGRLDHTATPEYTDHIFTQLPSDYLKRLYFDTVVHDPREIENLVRRYGADHIMLGSDWPYRMGETDPLGLLDRCDLIASDRAAIAGGTAMNLFNLKMTAA